MIGAAFGQDESSVVVGWLPLYHDMGLIGNVLQPLYAGAPLRADVAGGLPAAAAALAGGDQPLPRRRPAAAPTSPTSCACARSAPEALAGLDLSSWRVAFNGAEPVRAATLERFAEAFAPCGFRARGLLPLLRPGRGDAVRRRRRRRRGAAGGARSTPPAWSGTGRGVGARAIPEPATLVGCGRRLGGPAVAIVDPETGRLPAGPGGRDLGRRPERAAGYWQPARSRLSAAAGDDGPFLRTGDLGFLAGGELYVTGRLKDLIILRGRNHYPQDVELTAERAHPDLRPAAARPSRWRPAGRSGWWSSTRWRRHREDGIEEIAEAVRRAVAEEHEVQVHEVVLIRQARLPKTSSGKVQRQPLPGALPAGRAAGGGAERAGGGRSGAGGRRASLTAGSRWRRWRRTERREMLAAYLRERAAAALGVPASAVAADQPLTSLGLDSLAAVELKAELEAAFGVASRSRTSPRGRAWRP